ncbi:MAG: T9SS type A sorting domain-containing protein [Tannerellaceae bacterium]|nr:T9SS type A sorting domain-containing protein [Tannerellaceae bacterium]
MKRLLIASILISAISFFPGKTNAQDKVVNTYIQDKTTQTVEISVYENRIIVKNAPVNSRLEIYSVVGIKVKEIPLKQSSGEYPVNISKGYYIVRIADTVRKVIIR